MNEDCPDSEQQLISRYELDFTLDRERDDVITCLEAGGGFTAIGGLLLSVSSEVGQTDGSVASVTEMYLGYSGGLCVAVGMLVFLSGYQSFRSYKKNVRMAQQTDY